METIPHRELRNNSSAVLARVSAGESFAVTNHGRVAALLVPASESELQRLIDAGAVRAASRRPPHFSRIRRARSIGSAQLLKDLRDGR